MDTPNCPFLGTLDENYIRGPNVDYPSFDEEFVVARQTTAVQADNIKPVLTGEEIIDLQTRVREVPVTDHVIRYALSLVRQTRVDRPGAPDFVQENISWGAGPRAVQFLILGGKARALLQGRFHVSTDDIRAVAHPVLRHRLITNYTAEAEGLTSDAIIDQLLETVQTADDDGGRLPEVFGS